MSRHWANQRQKQGGVQGLNNGKINALPQQLSAAQLTYAQKVKGRRGAAPKAQQLQQGQGGMRNPQFRMVQTQNILQPQVSALQNYAYPYNYSNLQQQQQQQRRPPQTQPQPQSANPYRTRRGTGPQRDFFDRRVQHNLNNAVSQYYNYPQSNNNNNGMNRYAPNQSQPQPQPPQQQSMYRQQSANQFRFNNNSNSNNNNNNMNMNMNSNMNMRGRRNPRFRGGRGGGRGSFGQRPSYRDSQRPNFKNAPNVNRMPQQGNVVSNKANKRTKPSELQLNRYQNAADRDVLCWIFENQGKCRYGEKCQWLHLDRETGQYIPTVYIMNSLSDKNIRRDTICKEVDSKKAEADDDEDDNDNDKDNDEKAQEAEDESDTDPEELKNKFLLLMAEGIKKRKEEEKKRLIEEETKKNEEEDDKKQNGKGKEEDEDTKEQQQQQCLPVDSDKKSKYASYGTTFDRHNVCWEFNTFVGCRKGSKCKWAHQYLVKETAHPYTGEKLNGMAVRKFRVSNNI